MVTDWLSFTHQLRDGKPNPLAADDPDDATLTNRFHRFVPQLIPQSFNICPLPTEILSFVTLVLQTTESSMIRWNRRRMTTGTGPGGDGKDSAMKLGSWTTSSLTYPPGNANSSSDPFSLPTSQLSGAGQETFLQSIVRPWRERLCALPQATWLRRFGTISNQVPFTSRTAPSSSPPSMPS